MEKYFSKQSQKHAGVWRSGNWDSHARKFENIESMSSWLCPEDRKLIWHPFSFRLAICHAKWRSRVLFLHSFEQLSPWIWRKMWRKSIRFSWESLDKAYDKISVVRDEFVDIAWCDKTVKTMWPWANIEVQARRGLPQLQKSFPFMMGDLGHEYFAMSIESSMMHSSWGQGLHASNRLWPRWYQYTRRSASCLAKCFWSSSNWALLAGGQCPSFFMMHLCRKHWLHLAWCVANLIRSKWLNSFCHTWFLRPNRNRNPWVSKGNP